MLSSLPKILDKNFVIGFFFPALLAVIAAAWAFPSLTPLDPVRSLSAGAKPWDNLINLVLLVFSVAILLMTANDTLYKVLEGYFPPLSWLSPLRWWHRFRIRRLQSRHDKIMQNWQTAVNNDKLFPLKKKQRAGSLRKKLQLYYPPVDEVMSTKFGNIIRSFEKYPFQVYGADSVNIWPRLASVIPKDFAALQDDARSQVDCFVSLTHLALFITLASLVGAVVNLQVSRMPAWNELTVDSLHNFLGDSGLRHVVFAGGGLAIAIFAYWRACVSARAWGDLVRSAFDCYLPALIKQLGFAVPPTASKRRDFWKEFNRLIVYREPMDTEWPLAETATTRETAAKKPEPGTTNGGPAENGPTAAEPEGGPTSAPEAGQTETANAIQAEMAAK
jgi:hypothetical protein